MTYEMTGVWDILSFCPLPHPQQAELRPRMSVHPSGEQSPRHRQSEVHTNPRWQPRDCPPRGEQEEMWREPARREGGTWT